MPQGAIESSQKSATLANATFQIENDMGKAFFSELGGITSELEHVDYMEASHKGVSFGRFLGKAKPPTVTLKRAMSTGPDSRWIWAWHQMARANLVEACMKPTTLLLYGAGDADAPPVAQYMLVNAVPTKVEIGGIKAGGTEVVIQTMTLQCDEILDMAK